MSHAESHTRHAYVNLSIEALWLARVIHDGLDVLLGNPLKDAGVDAYRTKVLSVSRDVFERLGVYGHSSKAANADGHAWTAASRTEFIRQVAVHWRAFIDASFGMTCASELILSLTDGEIRVLEQVLQLDKEIRTNQEGVVFCMNQELNAWALLQGVQQALLRKNYLNAVQSK
jgi:hypothetical protein